MSAFGAFFWTFLVTFVFLWVFSMAVAIRPSAKDDELVAGAAQVIGYSLGLFVILRWYAPEASIREFLAMRPTAKALYPLALALGVALSPPLNYAYGRLLDRFPIDDPGGIAEAFGGMGAETFGVKSGGINKVTFTLAAIFCGSAILISATWNG